MSPLPDTALPIEPVLPALREALRAGTAAVLQAPPGAGKTTLVPLTLLDEPWLGGRKIVMLEPRRLAARAAANRMAQLRGERVGATVGYRVRMETRVGPSTRIEVVTEGVLTRMLQHDPALEGVGIVVFDEFHERSLHADLGLALTLQSRAVLRDDLRVLVMSATLDGGPVARLLGDAPVVTSEGRAYPVETRWLARRPEGRIEAVTARAVRDALETEEGDVLVFLPGAGEIRRVEEMLAADGLPRGVRIHPLFGNLPQEAQDDAIRPSPPGWRKIVLATSIAETSLTIEGVRVVVDSGLMRVPRFSPRTGMTRLETVAVSRASADQRRGRAGRLGPGVCRRLWTEAEDAALQPFRPPEILEADLAPLALELAAWGVADPAELQWLDPPPAAAFAQARELLRELGALDAAGAATPHGRAMAALPLHPRLAHMLLRAKEMRLGATACDLAALLAERDVLRGEGRAADADARLRLAALRREGGTGGHGVDPAALHRVRAEAKDLRRHLAASPADADDEAAGVLLALAYPDRIAQRRPGAAGRYLLRNGRGAAFPHPQSLSESPYLVAAELDDAGREGRILIAAPVEMAEIERHFADQIATEESVAWDDAAGAVRARRIERLGAIVLREAPLAEPDPGRIAAALADAVRQAGIASLPWTKASAQLRERIAFLHLHDPSFPDVSDGALLETLGDWLGPRLYGLRKMDEVRRIDLAPVLEGMLAWEQRRRLDELAPTHVEVPSGSRIAIDYTDAAAPVLAVRLQEVFGWTETPRIAGGRVPLTLHLLSPARRPVQVTRDLASFWRTGYFEVKKDLKGRYPKHYWPDDPLVAEATARARPRR
ncbi:ATP-dependent helicase HrpB [Longimicrobium sp.]|uniref:ATP-dependent helicase HrpB n=1 Tax=Longimicrobium sp. TaxID=2029185 RepID=UPI002BB2294E|nr:ATP-dependent helicase HrpB [Longimicrobium sp.]HSU15589.1 ATP-dependent helicase HrpB [Longimicrobium sp.]